ncbi:Aminotran-1-2 domain-containing protein [Aphelenchoides bicaudatus]|nr:Aminotran-1-2 domain-containing protein [Aphelenchoides bicaudatus]
MAAPVNKQTETIYDLFGPRALYALHVGVPPKKLLHSFAKLMSSATTTAVEREIESDDCLAGILQYGYPVGESNFREELAKFLTKEYGSEVNPANLVQTSGASLALVFMLNQLFSHKVPIYVEKVAYFRTLAILHGFHYETPAIRTELDGIDTKDLERVWERDLANVKTAKDEYAAVLYLVPQYSNPLGTQLSEDKSKEVVRLARKYNVLVICDDVYNLHYFDGIKQKRLFAYDVETDPDYDKDHVCSSGSFSKLFFPALRLGWVECGPTVRRKCFSQGAVTCSGGSMNSFTAAVVTEVLRSGAAHEHVRLNREDAARKMKIALDLLEKHLPSKCGVFFKPNGGYFVFVTLPMSIKSTDAFLHLKNNHDVFVNDGRLFWAGSEKETDKDYPMCNGLRVAIPYLEEEHLKLAVKQLCKGLTELCNDSNNNQS